MNRGAPALAADSGDVNCDETVNSVDALGVLRSTAGLSTPACSDAADVNCDDAVNAIDSLFILRFVAGLPVNLPDGCPPVGTSLGGPLLNEVLFLPAPGDDQFVELAGPGSLGGLTLVDESDQTYALPAGLPALAADDVLLIVFDGGNNVAGNVVHASPAGFLEGASGSVELRGGAGVLDRVAWGVEQPNAVPLSTGGMWGEPEPGLTIGRAPESTEVGPSAWHPFEPDDATPGSHNVQPAVDALLPFDGAVLPPGQVTLHWYPVAGAEEYQVQVSTSDTFASTALDDIVGGPEIQVTLSAGEYFWRVGAIGDGGIAVLSAAQTLTLATDGPSVAAAAAVTENVPYLSQHKDTKMLLLESDRQTGDHAWDSAHPALDVNDKADNWNCALAALAMLNRFFGGDVSQDRIGYEIFKDRQAGPELDLNWGHGVNYPGQVEQAFAFALGITATPFPAYQNNTDEEWAFITAALDAGDPLLSTTRQHATVITGYVEEDGKKLIYMNDPWSGPYRTDLALAKFVWFWRPSGDPDPPDDEPGIDTDTDGDGIVDFDEVQRFHTGPTVDDTDRDQLTDKNDVAESVFGEFGYSAFGWVDGKRDWDNDGAPNELDCDSDNDGTRDNLDDDHFSAPPPGNTFVSCGLWAVVTLTWFTDTNLALWILPNPASNEEEALAQAGQPGWWSRIGGWCNPPSGPDDVPRSAVIGDMHAIEPESRYLAVKFVDYCRRGVPGPEDDGPQTTSFVLTIQYSDGQVRQIADTFTWQVDNWRLYGPYDFAVGQGDQPQEVRLDWDSVTDLNLYVLPLPAANESQAYAQHLLPGYDDDVDYECSLVPDNVTQRQAVATEVTADSRYIGVYFNHKCPYNPEGPHGSSDYVLTVHFANGRVEVYSDFLSRDINPAGEVWRLYGPFDFSPPP